MQGAHEAGRYAWGFATEFLCLFFFVFRIVIKCVRCSPQCARTCAGGLLCGSQRYSPQAGLWVGSRYHWQYLRYHTLGRHDFLTQSWNIARLAVIVVSVTNLVLSMCELTSRRSLLESFARSVLSVATHRSQCAIRTWAKPACARRTHVCLLPLAQVGCMPCAPWNSFCCIRNIQDATYHARPPAPPERNKTERNNRDNRQQTTYTIRLSGSYCIPPIGASGTTCTATAGRRRSCRRS